MLTGAALAVGIAAVWSLCAITLGIAIGRAAAMNGYGRRLERDVERELRRRRPELRVVVSGACSADADEAVVDEHRHELRTRSHL
jgi:hypothetical protein